MKTFIVLCSDCVAVVGCEDIATVKKVLKLENPKTEIIYIQEIPYIPKGDPIHEFLDSFPKPQY